MKAPSGTPVARVSLNRIEDSNVRDVLFNILQALELEHKLIITTINLNELTQYSQATQPVIASGTAAVWEDTAATPGNPKAYMMANIGGATYTFASVQLA